MFDERESFFRSNRDVLAVAGLSILVLLIYAQTSGFQYINFDDNYYVYENPVVRSGLSWETVKWSFSAFYAGNWHPLTWLSLAADVSIWGVEPGRAHVVNVMFHLLNSVLAFVVFRQMTGRYWASLAIAALFAVHPAHVESVAWVAERKDVLSMLFWMLTMWSYLRWARSGEKAFSGWYLSTLACLALGLMAKPMLVTLPFVLLLCDIWPLNRAGQGKLNDYTKLAIEKIPFFVLSVISSIITITAQRSADAVATLQAIPLILRAENAILAYAKYVLTAFWPTKLAVWYPYNRELSLTEVAIAAVFLIAVTVFVTIQFSHRKYLLTGWLWFLITLVPVIGFVQVGGQSMADRYTYVPYLGLSIMVVFGAADIFEMLKLNKRVLIAGCAVSVAVLAYIAFAQTRKWQNDETLYRDTLAVTSGNYVIAQNLCGYLILEKRIDDAEEFCHASVDSAPNYYPAVNGIGMISFSRADYPKAEAEFLHAASLAPGIAGTYSNLALSQMLQGKTAEAEATLAKASGIADVGFSPTNFIPALRSLAVVYAGQNNYQKAFENLNRILFLTPDDLDARTSLAVALVKLGRYDEAQAQCEAIIHADPDNAQVHNIYGLVLVEKARPGTAIAEFEIAIRLKPDFEEAKQNLADAKAKK